MALKGKPQLAGGQWNQRKKLLDEYIQLDREVADFKPKLLRYEKLRQIILDWHPGIAGDEELTLSGAGCDILISARDRLRTVTEPGKRKLFKLWGQKDFLAKAHIFLKSLPDPEDGDGLYTVQSHIGPRHLRVVRVKSAAASPAA
jgi:hypothetical protein